MNNRFVTIVRWVLLVGMLFGFIAQPQYPVSAAAILSVSPLTWNIIGLDSNNVNVGPNHFPVGARVCNTGDATATNVKSAFNWVTTDIYINLRSGTFIAYTSNGINLNPGQCTDFYYEVEITRNSAAYNHTARYTITASADGGLTGSTPTPRELFVEHLVSQNRNAVTNVLLNGVSIAPGGTMNLMVGQTYTIMLEGFTATQGYEQLEAFINFPNTIFQVLSVSSTYDHPTNPYTIDKLYSDACTWENDPNSPNYRACLGVGKSGGNITVTYQVKILQVPAAPLVNPEPLSTLVYDFSGSSYHYNADYGVSTRYANIINASLVKAFSPKTINPGGSSALTFTINNPGPSAISNVNFTDTLPSGVPTGVTLFNTAVTYNGCGVSPSPSTLTVNGPPQTLAFTNITVAALSTCTISVNVTGSTVGTYNNTTGNLFIGTTDTGSSASDTLTVTAKPPAPSSCATPVTLATWSFPPAGQGSGGGATAPDYTTRASDVLTATALYTTGAAGTPAISTVEGSPAVNSWSGTNGWAASSTGFPSATTGPYFTFTVDTSNYGGVRASFNYALLANGDWANPGNNFVYVYSSADAAAYSTLSTITASKGSWFASGTFNATTTGASTTAFRINAIGANKTTSAVFIDEIVITGCSLPVVPTLSKSFLTSPIPQGSSSTLRFTLTNPNTATALTGVGFSDTLPTGLLVATPNGLTTTCTVGTLTGGTTTATAGTSIISRSGATLSANANCTISVNVLGNVAGQYTNISGTITSTETGPNTTSTGYGTSSLTVIAPPVIAKSFTANPIFTGNTTNLTFSINNPNSATTLTGITFIDTLPGGLVVATPNGLSNSCGGTATATAGSSTVSLTGVSLTAGASCALSVDVTGNTAGLKANSVQVSSTNGGTGNTSTASVLVKDAAPLVSMLKQVGPTAAGPWTSFLTLSVGGNVYYKFTVENIGDLPLNPVTVTDDRLSLAGCTWVDGDGTTLTAPYALPVADANNNQLMTCVLGPITAVAGLNVNTATATGTNGTNTIDLSSATYATPALTIVKSAAEPYYTAVLQVLHYGYVVTNSGSAPLLGPVTVADDKTTVTCPAVSTAIQTAPPGPGDGDNWLDVGESITCAATYIVTGGDVATGTITNTASATADGVTSANVSTTIGTPADLAVAKTNNVSGSVALGTPFIWTLTVSNGGNTAATFTAGQTILSDLLPVGPTYGTPTPGTFVNITNTGNISCNVTAGTLACTANGGSVTIGIGGSFVVSFTVTPVAGGSLANTARVDPNNNITETNEANNDGLDTVNVLSADLVVTKTDGVAAVNANGTTTYTVRATNNGPSSVTGAILSDPSMAGLSKTGVACSGTPGQCTALTTPTIAQLEGGAFTLPALVSGQFYEITITANVTALSGTVANTATIATPAGTSDPIPGNNSATDTDNVTPQADLAITKTDGVAAVNANGTTTYTVRVTNNGPSSVTGAILSDPSVAGLSKTGVVCSGTPGQCTALTTPTIAQLEGGAFTLPALTSGQFYEVTITANVTALSGTVTNTATIAPPVGTTDPTPGNNTGTDTDNVTPVADLSITKTDSVLTVNANGATTYTVHVTNNGPSSVTGAILSDLLASGLSKTSILCSATPGQCLTPPSIAQLEGGSFTLPALASGQFYEITITANVTATSGSVTNTAMVAAPAGTTDPTPGNNTANDTDNVINIIALDDSGSTVNGTPGGQSLANVLTNDTLNGNPATLANITLTQVSTTNAGVTLDVTTGAVNVAPGTPTGNYIVTYQICDQANPTICDTATVTVPVVVIDAVNDTGSTVSGTTGGQSLANVLTNDTLNGNPATLVNVNLTQVSTTNPGVTLDVTTGAVNVAPGTPTGTYTVTYQICDQANPTICDTATVTVPVVVINAVNDSASTVDGATGGQSLANVLTNDTLNGNPATLANVTLSQVSTTNPGVTLDATTGAVNVALGTPSGSYTVTYQICDQANPTICDTATVTVPVVTIDAVNDTGSIVDGTAGGQAFADVLTNDTLNGNPATLANITLTQVSTTNAGVTLDVTTGAVNVAPGTPSGNYTVTYQICDQANPTICDTATVSVPVVVINAVNDDFSGTPVNGYTGGNAGNAFTNDTLNGAAVTPAQIIATVINPASNAGVMLNTSTGSVDIAAGTPVGTYTIDYQICDLANPTICDIATITVVVAPPVINAVNDDFSGTPVNGYTGGNAGNAFTNDTLNGVAVIPAQITATVTSPASDPGVTLNTTTGSVDVAAGTPAGIYTIGYEICENLNPTNCDIATITVVVSPPVINAVDDSATGVNGVTGATAVLNVFDNDTLNGSLVVPSEVTLTETVPDPSGALTLNPNGTVDVAPGTAAGTYQLTYRICEILNPTNCDTAIASVTVGLPPAPVAQNDNTTTPFNTPATLTDITANDTAFGTGNSIVINTIDLDPAAAGQQTSFTDSNGNQWSVNTTTGDVTFTPATNYTGTATIPYSVQDASGQTATANLSVTVGPPAGISGVVFNDADLNGTKSSSEPGINTVKVDLYDSTGTILIASVTTTSGGAYSFPNLAPGTYIVIETDPAGYVSTTPNSVPATVSAGGSATVNFGDYKLSNSTLSNINGIVYNDANGNGTLDSGETPLTAVTVELKNNIGTVIATTTTNASGGYSFINLVAGTYIVTETDPPGYISTTLNNVAVNLSAGTTATINFGDQTSGGAQIADPAVTKYGSPTSASVGSAVVYTITVGNNGNINATNVVLTDTKPAFLDILSITISPNPGLTPAISGNTFTINFGTVAPTDFYVVTIVTRVNSLGQPPGGSNNVSITTNSITDRTFNNAAAATLQIPSSGGGTGNNRPALPDTGFAPGIVTDLSRVPRETYASTDEVTLEVSSLGIKIPIVGVPLKNGTWNVSWLGKQAGWLAGSAFPSWNGNSVLTSHVYLSNGLPGPFVNLNKLKFGDKIIVHAFGQKYTFEVQTNVVVASNDSTVFKHEEKPWLTLVTCKEYDAQSRLYKKRVVVRAVLVKVEADK